MLYVVAKAVDKKNKIVVSIDDMEINFRRDEFYGLMTWVFNNGSWTDDMDELMLSVVGDPKAPASKILSYQQHLKISR